MPEEVEISRKIYGKKSFTNVVDTSFNQLVPKDNSRGLSKTVEVKNFFDDYNSIFYDIPKTDKINSHLDIINKSSEYLGISLEDLNKELQQLRDENVSLKNQILNSNK